MDKGEKEIRKLVDTWMDASKKGDVKKVLELMTNDVIFMIPGQKPFGKEAFEIASREMKDIKIKGKSNIQEIKVLGDWAYMRNYIKIKMTLPNQHKIEKSGYTLTILKKESGKWKISRDANLLTVENK
ncbi:SgcJ/EcaC family oxidoreductase [Candidatus Woesearchaeota archaeon]|nr:SgcJ/EcaC family oxidoreductase [Candidatus Woesearchaeota archaeon]